MKIVFLPTTAADFDWITEYYLSSFRRVGATRTGGLIVRCPTCQTTRVSVNPLHERHIANIQFRERHLP